MTNLQLKTKLTELVTQERKLSNEILELIALARSRRAHLDFGYGSLFDWLTKGLGYSAGAAQRRIDAASLLKVAPEIKEKLASGELNLTTVSKVQTAIRAQEKIAPVKAETKQAALKAVENTTLPEAEKKLCELFPALKSSVHQERRQTIDENTVRHSVNLPRYASELLEGLKLTFSHKFPKASDADIIIYALEQLAAGQKPTSTVEVKACEYKAQGKTCGSRYQVQRDHILPKALGGSDAPENLRYLCRQHNLLAAEQRLGVIKMSRYWRRI